MRQFRSTLDRQDVETKKNVRSDQCCSCCLEFLWARFRCVISGWGSAPACVYVWDTRKTHNTNTGDISYSNGGVWPAGSAQSVTVQVGQTFSKTFTLRSLSMVSPMGNSFGVCSDIYCEGAGCDTITCSLTVPRDPALTELPLVAEARWADCRNGLVLGPIFCTGEQTERAGSAIRVGAPAPLSVPPIVSSTSAAAALIPSTTSSLEEVSSSSAAAITPSESPIAVVSPAVSLNPAAVPTMGSFNPGAVPPPANPSPSSNADSESQASSSSSSTLSPTALGFIIGGVVAAVLALALVGFLAWHSRSGRSNKPPIAYESDMDADSTFARMGPLGGTGSGSGSEQLMAPALAAESTIYGYNNQQDQFPPVQGHSSQPDLALPPGYMTQNMAPQQSAVYGDYSLQVSDDPFMGGSPYAGSGSAAMLLMTPSGEYVMGPPQTQQQLEGQQHGEPLYPMIEPGFAPPPQSPFDDASGEPTPRLGLLPIVEESSDPLVIPTANITPPENAQKHLTAEDAPQLSSSPTLAPGVLSTTAPS